MSYFSSHIDILFEQGYFDEVFIELKNLIDEFKLENLSRDCMLLSARYSKNKRDENRGTVGYNDLKVNENRIYFAIMDLYTQIKKEIAFKLNESAPSEESRNEIKRIEKELNAYERFKLIYYEYEEFIKKFPGVYLDLSKRLQTKDYFQLLDEKGIANLKMELESLKELITWIGYAFTLFDFFKIRDLTYEDRACATTLERELNYSLSKIRLAEAPSKVKYLRGILRKMDKEDRIPKEEKFPPNLDLSSNTENGAKSLDLWSFPTKDPVFIRVASYLFLFTLIFLIIMIVIHIIEYW